ncbi:MAG: hypothetical protein NT121_21790, partial [Chloroflexi bacterium]|nr:hypothetical protein [Chloroflexota bacterium]
MKPSWRGPTPGVGKEFTDHGAVAGSIHSLGDLQEVPAQRSFRAGEQLAHIHTALRAWPVQRPAPALAKIQDDDAVVQLGEQLKRQAFGRHGFPEAGIPYKSRVKVAIRIQLQ